MILIRGFLACILLCSAAVFVVGQDKKPPKNEEDQIIRVDTELVDVPVVVTDKAGKPILNLRQSNFIVTEDGKPQEITEFSATNAPFEVALLLDTSGSARADLALIQRSAQNFINALRPGDRVSILAFHTEVKDKRSVPAVEVVIGLTDDRSALMSALARVGTSNGTPYYDGMLKIATSIFGEPPPQEFRGRRAVVALTDGVDSTSISEFGEAREALEKAGIICYFIKVDTREFFEENLLGNCEVAIRFSMAQIRRYYKTFAPQAKVEKASDFCQLGDFERLAVSKQLYELAGAEMEKLAKDSGGKVFPVGDLGEARVAFKSVADEIGTKYSIGYYSSNEKRDGTYRAIKVAVKGLAAGTQIRARQGYTARVR